MYNRYLRNDDGVYTRMPMQDAPRGEPPRDNRPPPPPPSGGNAPPPRPPQGDAPPPPPISQEASQFFSRILDKLPLKGVDTADILLLLILFFLFEEKADDELLVALGLLLILPAAIRLEAFEYLEKEQIALAYGVEGIVERQKQEYAPTYRRSMTQGVVLCVLAVVPILGTAMLGVPDFWVAAAVGLLLAIVAGAVQLFIRAGMIQGSFDKLLQTGEYTVREKWTNRRVGWFAGAYWCLVTAVYLAVSFWNNNWEKSWIIWAVAGLVFAALYSAVRAWADRKNQ